MKPATPRWPTPEITAQVAAFIRAGGYPEVAAPAAGVPVATYRRWMSSRHSKRTRAFRQAVETAAAQARLRAEMHVHADDPKAWLTKGPGKDQPGVPGWSREVKPVIQLQDRRTVNLLADPTSSAMLGLLLKALEAFPDARRAAIAALNQASTAAAPQPLPPTGRPDAVVLPHVP